MTARVASNEPFWFTYGESPQARARLSQDLTIDVAVIGGGIVGLVAAHLLAEAGRSVAVLEARRIGRQATGKSTAKITSQHNVIYKRLIEDLGEDGARRYGAANEAAGSRIAALCDTLAIACDLQDKSAYVYAASEDQVSTLEEEAEAARSLGLPAAFTRALDAPFPAAGAVRFDGQRQFNPYAFLVGLARGLESRVSLFENTRVTAVEHGEPCRVTAEGATVTARQVIVATQMPVVPQGSFFAKAYPFAHPVAAARLPAGRSLEGMFISLDQPSHSTRTASRNGETWIVAAGGSYKPGHTEEAQEMAADLTRFLRDHFGVAAIDHLWTNEDFGPMDQLPFIGRASASTPNLYVATGFNAWGITTGVLAAEIITDRILQRSHAAADLFDSTRLRPIKGGAAFLSENVKAGVHLVRDRVLKQAAQPLDSIAPGEGGIINQNGEQLAVTKDAEGRATAHSAICTHLGCVVGWNPIDRSWDCPCHGSRFDAQGEVMSGPAVSPLKPRRIG